MVAALVVLSFVLLIVGGVVVGAIFARRQPAPAELVPGEAERVEGFELRSGLDYHPGHLWVGKIGKNRVRVGVDDFARRILGPPERITLPGVGRELCEGVLVIELMRAGRTIRLPAPVDGTVASINREVIENPSLAATDPLGRGWLIEVRLAGSRAKRPLLRGRRAQDWMTSAVNRMRAVLTGSAGLAMTDGGLPVEDYKLALDEDAWGWLVEWTLSGEADEHRR